jgi:hypothetical protein
MVMVVKVLVWGESTSTSAVLVLVTSTSTLVLVLVLLVLVLVIRLYNHHHHHHTMAAFMATNDTPATPTADVSTTTNTRVAPHLELVGGGGGGGSTGNEPDVNQQTLGVWKRFTWKKTKETRTLGTDKICRTISSPIPKWERSDDKRKRRRRRRRTSGVDHRCRTISTPNTKMGALGLHQSSRVHQGPIRMTNNLQRTTNQNA